MQTRFVRVSPQLWLALSLVVNEDRSLTSRCVRVAPTRRAISSRIFEKRSPLVGSSERLDVLVRGSSGSNTQCDRVVRSGSAGRSAVDHLQREKQLEVIGTLGTLGWLAVSASKSSPSQSRWRRVAM
ncbi:hypothetical protein TIFTF001_007041 [Ficus carica]|uniref:Uncharacterized protein n=1 Tax=Ficus carica TaxID=3494 RepID=A0AA88D1H2_FICCA|nr:hypothetical protein TIFTF001_007041 [Ficus carica]